MPIYRHHLVEVELKALRPTQMTVGMGEVRQKSDHWRTLDPQQRSRYLSRHWFPAVRGPKARYYIIDHHHLGMALILEKVQSTQLVLMKDFAALSQHEFWVVMDHYQWVHPYDSRGHRRDFSELPRKLTDLIDDPYRSLAGVIKSSGGFPKDGEPFAEFLWADFFRRRISAHMLQTDPEAAVCRAQELAHGRDASHLPGWSGVNVDGEDDLDPYTKT